MAAAAPVTGVAALAELPEPIELIDLEHGNSIVLSITSFQTGKILIHPKNPGPRQVSIYMQQNGLTAPPAPGTPISNWVPDLRVFGTRLDKPSPLKYWDISGKRLQAQLVPMLEMHRGALLTVKLTAHGEKPQKTYSVESA